MKRKNQRISDLLFHEYDFKHEIKLQLWDILLLKLKQKLVQFRGLEYLLYMLFDTDDDIFTLMQSKREKSCRI